MKPIPWMAATAAMGIVVGFLAGRNTDPSGGSAGSGDKTPSVTRSGSAGGQRDRPGRPSSGGDEILSRFINGRSVQSLSAADVTEIIRANVNTDPNEDPLAAARRNFQLQLLLSKLPVAMLGEVTQQVMEDAKLRSSEGYKIFGVWANRDWKAALEWADSNPEGSRWAGQALSALAANDPGLASQLLSERILSGKSNDSYLLPYGVGRAHAKLGADSLMQFIESLPSSQQSNVLMNSVRDIPEGELLGMVERLHQQKGKNGMQDYAFTNMFAQLIKTNPEQARQWLDQMPTGEEKSKLELSVVGSLAGSGKGDEAVDYLKSAMANEPGKEKDFLKRAVNTGYSGGAEMFAKLAEALPPGVEMAAADLEGFSNIGYGGGTNFLNVAAVIRNPEEKVKYLSATLDKATAELSQSNRNRGFNDVDFQILETRVASLDLSADQKQTVAASLQKYREATKNKDN